MAEKRIVELEIETNLGSLKEQLAQAKRQVQDLANEFGSSSQQVANAADEVRALEKEIKQTNKTLKSIGIEGKFQAITGSITGALNGLQAIQGSLAIVGIQSGTVEESLLKVQSAMALADGIEGVFQAQKSFEKLGNIIKANTVYQKISTAVQYVWNAAMSANPIGTMIVVITALIAVGYKLITMFQESAAANDKAASATKQNTSELNKQIKANERVSQALKTKNGHELDMARASGASAEAIRKLALKHADEEIALEKASLATARNTYEKEKNTLANYKNLGVSDEIITKQRELVTASRKNVQEEVKDLSDAYKNRQDIIRANQVEVKQEQTDAKKSAVDSNKEKNDKIAADQEKANQDALDKKKAFDDAVLAYNDAIEQERISRLTSEKEKEEVIINAKYVKLKELAVKAGVDTKALTEQQAIDLTNLNLKYAKIEQDKKDELKKAADEKAAAEKVKLQELTLSEEQLKLIKLQTTYKAEQLLYKDNAEILLALKKKYEDDVLVIETTAAEKSQAEKRQVTEKQIQMVMSGLSIINDLFQMNANKSEKDARRAFKVNKAFNLATALTNTYLAVTSALATKTELFPGQRFIEAGLAGAAGAVQVAKISKTQFESGGTPDTTMPSPSSSSASAPNFNVVGNSGLNQLAQIQQQPIQAYVVSGEVTSAQALDRNRIKNATL